MTNFRGETLDSLLNYLDADSILIASNHLLIMKHKMNNPKQVFKLTRSCSF